MSRKTSSVVARTVCAGIFEAMTTMLFVRSKGGKYVASMD